MKTLKFFLTLVLCAMTAVMSHAQTNYYTVTQVFQGNGYSYQCENYGGLIELYNSTNQFRDVTQTLNGALFDPDIFYDQNVTYSWEAQRQQAQALAAGIFTSAEINLLKSDPRILTIRLYIDPQTGKIQDIEFKFSNRFNYAKIPVERYRAIELALKNNLTFQIATAEKQLNYCFTWLRFDPTTPPVSQLAAPVISSEFVPRATGGQIDVVFSVDDPLPGVSYEWQVNEMPYTTTTSNHRISFLSPFNNPLRRSLTSITVRCRARSGSDVSAWSNELGSLIGSVEP